ncbi:MAG: class I SAM-dependent methyltransferase [Anaerolineae bacterium]
MNRFRRQRFAQLFKVMNITDDTTILDVGGLPYDWVELDHPGQVLCVSLSDIREGQWGEGNITYSRQDATGLPYPDNSFDLVYSNSLLEHVGRGNQAKVAEEIRRLGNRYWVQVPHRNFPFEPHYRALFFYQMPLSIRRLIAKYWTSLILKRGYYLSEVDTIYPLTYREMQSLFPDAMVLREKFLGITKSLIAVMK